MTKRLLPLAFTLLLAAPTLVRGEDAPTEPGRADLFSQLDTNQDGQLTADEVPDDKKSLFERLVRLGDGNGDGKLAAEEFAAGLAGGKPSEAAGEKPQRPARPGARQRPGPEQLFTRLDANKDGKVALDEVPEERRERFAKLIALADKDGDNALSLEEFSRNAPAGAPGQAPGARRPDPSQLFGRMDRNGDGKVTADEIPEERRPMVERLIERGDKDNDGALTLEELTAAFAARAGKPAGDAAPGNPKKKKKPAEANAAKGKKKAAKAGSPQGLFAALDADHDGQLVAAEIDAAPAVLRKLDRDGDGNLTPRELLAGAGGKPKKKKKPQE